MESIELPDSYEETCLFLMAVESHRVYVIWDVGPDERQKMMDQGHDNLQPVRFILRFHDVTGINFDGGNSHASFDVEVDVNEKKHYIPIKEAGRAYLAEIGTVNGTGAFSPLARSNVTEMPRNGISSQLVPQLTMDHEFAVQGGVRTTVLPESLSHDRLNGEQENLPKAGATITDVVKLSVAQGRVLATGVAKQEEQETIRPGDTDKTFSILATDVLARDNLLHPLPPDANKMWRHGIRATRVIQKQGQKKKKAVDLTEVCETKFVAGISSK